MQNNKSNLEVLLPHIASSRSTYSSVSPILEVFFIFSYFFSIIWGNKFTVQFSTNFANPGSDLYTVSKCVQMFSSNTFQIGSSNIFKIFQQSNLDICQTSTFRELSPNIGRLIKQSNVGRLIKHSPATPITLHTICFKHWILRILSFPNTSFAEQCLVQNPDGSHQILSSDKLLLDVVTSSFFIEIYQTT